MSSEVFKHGRMDAGFHLINQEYADRAEALSVAMSVEDAVALLSDEQSIPTAALQFLAPLTRGSNGKPTRDQLLRAIKEYPFLALAIVKDKGRDLLEEKQNELAQQVQKMNDARLALASAGPTIQGLATIPFNVRGLLNQNRFVAGVAYFDGDTLSIPVETASTAYVWDCWVIELADWKGPETIDELVASGDVPVPRRHEDLGKPVGFITHLADHTPNYGKGWGG